MWKVVFTLNIKYNKFNIGICLALSDANAFRPAGSAERYYSQILIQYTQDLIAFKQFQPAPRLGPKRALETRYMLISAHRRPNFICFHYV